VGLGPGFPPVVPVFTATLQNGAKEGGATTPWALGREGGTGFLGGGRGASFAGGGPAKKLHGNLGLFRWPFDGTQPSGLAASGRGGRPPLISTGGRKNLFPRLGGFAGCWGRAFSGKKTQGSKKKMFPLWNLQPRHWASKGLGVTGNMGALGVLWGAGAPPGKQKNLVRPARGPPPYWFLGPFSRRGLGGAQKKRADSFKLLGFGTSWPSDQKLSAARLAVAGTAGGPG